MRVKIVSGIMLTLLLTSMFTLGFNVQQVKASGTIVIEADGSINPPSANITSADNITYYFTDNNYDEIVVERNNITIDGNGHTLQGTGGGVGFELMGVKNVTIKNTNIKSFSWGIRSSASCANNTVSGNNITSNTVGIRLASSSNNTVSSNNITNNIGNGVVLVSSSNNNTISGNIIANNTDGVYFYVDCFNNTVSGNTITNNTNSGVYLRSFHTTVTGNDIIDNGKGVYFFASSNNTFYHNNFINNTQQVLTTPGYANFWNSSYPSGGNYWSNYAGVDEKSGQNQDEDGSDGIGDTAHVLDDWNQDNYPYMNKDGWVRVRNINTTLGYWAIQEAIDAFETLDEHTIQVDAGTYVENVDVAKQLNIIGAGTDVTIVEASDPNDRVFYVTANNVNISGFTVKNANGSGGVGVYLRSSFNNTVSGNNITNNTNGVFLYESSNNTVSDNNITNNTNGVHLYSSSNNNTISGNNITNNTDIGVWLIFSSNNNTVSGNNITNNNDTGVYLKYSRNNTVSGNNITNNTICGVYLPSSFNNTVSGNTITNNNYGVYLHQSSNNTVSGNTITNSTNDGVGISSSFNNTVSDNNITNNTICGVYLSSSSFNNVSGNTITNNTSGVFLYLSSNITVSGNNITNNRFGVYLSSSFNNTVSDNNITNNIGNGVRLFESSDNWFHHNNFIDNTQQVLTTPGYTNFWNSSYPSGGNYWSNYADVDEKSGPKQDEDGSDGIGDTAHVLDSWNIDNYPHMNKDRFLIRIPDPKGGVKDLRIETNATLTHIVATKNNLHFQATGDPGETYYINATIPVGLNTTAIQVKFDETWLEPPPWPEITTNGTHYFIYFEFTASTHEIAIQYGVLGDVDRNGVVNILDIKLVKLAYSGWIIEPNADIDDNGVINILDLKLVKLAFSGLIG